MVAKAAGVRPEGSWRRLWEQERCKWGVGRVRPGGVVGSRKAVGGSMLRGVEQECSRCWELAPQWGELGPSGGIGGAWGILRGVAGVLGGGAKSPALDGYAA